MARGINVTPLTLQTADSDASVAAAASLRLLGFTARESAASPAVASFKVVHGATGNGGTLVAPVSLPASGFVNVVFPDGGIPVPNGVSIDFGAGRYDIAFYTLEGNA